ncbi:probable leucine--tRNA ligase, mitochondrial isoform X2 [Cyprinus carpio]|uniref:leucine--tRNA ligase n=1 Tax=Cyprinus carpio TaxID=7962 RepID=A0A9Q9X6V2_CYPCA|nr:probable leucine--tRNA ligase, mitochondrial isoform X2 [Cyprinus carpio]
MRVKSPPKAPAVLYLAVFSTTTSRSLNCPSGLSVGFGPQTEGPETPNPSFFNMRERPEARKIWENRNYAITQITGHFTEDFLFNAAISRLIGLTNTLSQALSRVVLHSVEFEETLESLCVMAAPMCPHLASEIWAGITHTSTSVCQNMKILSSFTSHVPKAVI